ncbi:MAG: hypothetical protein ABIG66_03130 [Candidatus Kerfeldbacteria bacterium]
MELKTHARILNNTKWFILVFTVLVTIAAFVYAVTQPERYKAVVSFEVNYVNRPVTLDYQYGEYYELKAAEIFTQHLISLFKTPGMVADIYDQAKQEYEIETISKFTGRFLAKQYSAQHFVVEFYDGNADTAYTLGDAVSTVVKQRSRQASTLNNEAMFTLRAEEPAVAPAEYNIWLVTVIGAVSGLILSVILVYLREYFRQP